ncbi:hypothetical protein EX895_004227 [Sporisorium graminicola]|uniref:Uncharacterized protein n=1 Tax=Sporisorium graminicola TaxID=280036 RepID=A0A4V6ETK2_9BASI|nr:hypothetical protein EX895_004227 [Sporisorium graminicola]TKY86939.1 hypothetical protein EX895_004227 [Sporisorium graminicola]
MAGETSASCLLFVRICQLKLQGKDMDDFIQRLQSLSLEYKQATAGRAVEDDALKAILINATFTIPEYHLVVKDLTERARLTDYFTVAQALQKRWREIK